MCVDQNGDTPLILAIINENSVEALNIIKNGNCYPHIVNSYGDTALLLSIHKNMPYVAINKYHKNNFGFDALAIAKSRNYTELFQYF